MGSDLALTSVGREPRFANRTAAGQPPGQAKSASQCVCRHDEGLGHVAMQDLIPASPLMELEPKLERTNRLTRRAFLALVSTLGYLTVYNGDASATSIDRIYRRVRTIILYARVSAEKQIREVIKTEHLLQSSVSLISREIKHHRPEILVIYKPPGPYDWPKGASESTTLRILLQITVTDLRSESPQIDGYLGSVGLRLERASYIRGRDWHPSQPFVSVRDTDALNTKLLEMVTQELERGVIGQILLLGSDG